MLSSLKIFISFLFLLSVIEYLEKEGRKESSVLITYCKNLDYKEKTVKRAKALLKNKIEAVKAIYTY